MENLFTLQDLPYRAFQCRLMPTVDPATVIGVRTPALRKIARALAGTPQAEQFLDALPHTYYEENNLHGLLLTEIRPADAVIRRLDAFLPYVNNWATCDLLAPHAFRSCPPTLYPKIQEWIASGQTYTVRFAIGTLMRFYLGDAFCPAVLDLAADVRTEAYYVRMMTAWFFATALAKRYEETLPFLLHHRLDPWTHNKTIRKAVESNRICMERKIFLRTLTIK